MGAWGDQLAMWGGPDCMDGALGGMALDYIDEPEPMGTGIAALDALVGGGLPRGEVTVLAGTAGMGKTALACQLAYHAAMRGERPVYCSFEMSRLKCLMRMVACHAALHPELLAPMPGPMRDVRWATARAHPAVRLAARMARERHAGDPEGRDRELAGLAALYEAQGEGASPDPAMLAWRDLKASVGAAGGMLVADSMRTLGDVEACVSACAGDGAAGLVVVDYAQLVETGDEKEYDRMATVSGGLRRLAKESRASLVLISALRKLSPSDRKEGPSMDWLKGNNALAYDAGLVAFLLRPDGEEGDPAPVRDVDLAVVKNRNGALGTCGLSYDAPHNLVTSRWLGRGERDTTGEWA